QPDRDLAAALDGGDAGARDRDRDPSRRRDARDGEGRVRPGRRAARTRAAGRSRVRRRLQGAPAGRHPHVRGVRSDPAVGGDVPATGGARQVQRFDRTPAAPRERGQTVVSTGVTMFEKIWSRHVVAEGPGGQTLLYVDRHLLHEGSTHAFTRLERSGRRVMRAPAMIATADHYVPTSRRGEPIPDPELRGMEAALRRSTGDAAITYFGPEDPRQGIVHVI